MSLLSIFEPVRTAYARLTRPTPWSLSELLTPLEVAVEELERRRKDPELMERVEQYLAGDIPEHFANGPILYLARHVASPNFETLRFLHLVEPVGIPAVISQDLKDRFVPKNALKKALGKLPVSTGVSMRDGAYQENYERVTVVDFNSANGKPFKDIRTLWGEDLASFHAGLFSALTPHPVRIVDDSSWIDRQHRGDLLAHYKKFLALFVTHGVLFEDYALEDKEEAQFIDSVLRPAYREVEARFGVRPLIAQLTPTSIETPEFWISYPRQVLAIVREKLAARYTSGT